jgi:4-carboxymuconolactone decarboxylase
LHPLNFDNPAWLALIGFYMSIEDQQAGEMIRREVMGTTHVDASLGNATDFDMPLQEAAMEHAWGGVWTREGLDRKTRSIVTVSMLIALQAHGELKGHVRGALNNGVSPEEIREIIMHAAAYCGYPAALSAMRVAREVIDNVDK